MNKISIVVPIYKVEKYLEKCLDSIICQTYKNLEIILVNDGSPDRCKEICDDYCKKDHRVRVIHKENGGLSSARNAGIEIATGDYIGFVDGDDYIEKDMFETLYRLALEHNADVVECSLNIVEGKSSTSIHSNGEVEVGDNIYSLKRLLQFPYRNVAYNKLYKKEMFESLRYPNKLYEDGFVTYKIFHRIKKYVFIALPLYNYIKREESIMARQKQYSLKNLDGLEVQEERYEYLKKVVSDKSILSLARRHYFNQIIYHYSMLNKNKSIDPRGKYRNLIKDKISKNKEEFQNLPYLEEYIPIICAANYPKYIFNLIFVLFHLKKDFNQYINIIKIKTKQKLT
ncbi:glycosyltransferase family 2 protein [Robertmurraya sp. GLU-23]